MSSPDVRLDLLSARLDLIERDVLRQWRLIARLGWKTNGDPTPDQERLLAEALGAMRSLGTRAGDAKRILESIAKGRTFDSVEEIVTAAYQRPA